MSRALAVAAVAAVVTLAACGDGTTDNVACPLLTEDDVASVMGQRLPQVPTETRSSCLYTADGAERRDAEFVSFSVIGGTTDDYLQSVDAARTALGAGLVDTVDGVGESAVGWVWVTTESDESGGYTVQAYQTDRLVIVTVVTPTGEAEDKAKALARKAIANF